MAEALAAYLEADRKLAREAMDDEARAAWTAIRDAAYSQIFFG